MGMEVVDVSHYSEAEAVRTRFTIGQLARRAGVGVQTVRYYERSGLLASDARTESGYRLYSDEAVDRLAFIRNAKALGFSLKDIHALLSLRLDSAASCADVRGQALARLQDVEARLRALERIRDTLRRLADACSGTGAVSACPILEALKPESGLALETDPAEGRSPC